MQIACASAMPSFIINHLTILPLVEEFEQSYRLNRRNKRDEFWPIGCGLLRMPAVLQEELLK